MIVDVPNTKYGSINANKTTHSKENSNKNLKVVLNRSSFEILIKMLGLNTGNKNMFVVERMGYNRLIKFYDINQSTLVFTAGLHEIDLIKLKLPSETELKDIADCNGKLYNDRIEDILSFQCFHCFHPLCLTAWNDHGLTIGNHEEHSKGIFVYKSILSNNYTDLYDYD